ncbi:hypothetical protein NA57DRAFT_80324 [Rhizodiscina lignyota]|uniref:U1-type domain-containing protein n=1 Tax=Rhizodiscina lignyota TaxID=1504668 RepID=A0A9P4I7F6_9PEZI|nr:hypothetical protein NA57DRAFT_80324 [Rhizodiscina lignyota]
MSEYWKSTPKYWCKFCKVYVRDTKFERQQHEATGRHQGNIQRSLRGLHRDQEREEREKQRAKDEVARLNGEAQGSSSGSPNEPPWKKKNAAPPPAPRQATAEDRKRQMLQLAEMGVAIPEEFRRDMAMASEWQTVSERIVGGRSQKKEEDEDLDIKPEARSIGVRKRKLNGEEEEDEAAGQPVKQAWGSAFKKFPGSKGADEDLDALLGGTKPTVKSESVVKKEEDPDDIPIKREESAGDTEDKAGIAKVESDIQVKQEDGEPAPAAASNSGESPIVFKKRKKKP